MTNLQPIIGLSRSWSGSFNKHADNRGKFVEVYRKNEFPDLVPQFVQDSFSKSIFNVLRGMHVQVGQWQLISILEGEILDIAIDLRSSSKSFMQLHSTNLTSQKNNQLLLGPGIAHGYLVKSDQVLIHYKSSKYYGESDQYCIDMSDIVFKDFLVSTDFIRSDRDINGMKLLDFLANKSLLEKMEIDC